MDFLDIRETKTLSTLFPFVWMRGKNDRRSFLYLKLKRKLGENILKFCFLRTTFLYFLFNLTRIFLKLIIIKKLPWSFLEWQDTSHSHLEHAFSDYSSSQLTNSLAKLFTPPTNHGYMDSDGSKTLS